VLRFGGEEVALPFVHHEEEPASGAPAMSLDLLAQAFAGLGEAPGTTPAAAEPQGTPAEARAGVASGESPDSGSRGRRGRRNRSASRAQGAANATNVEHHEVAVAASGGAAHEAKAPDAAPAKSTPAAEPIILGVGVPKSQL
jgi:ribonuclease E